MSNIDQAIGPKPVAAKIPALAYLLTLCVGVVGSNSLVLGPIAPDIAASFGTSTPAVMTASAAFGLGTAAGALLLARRIDRFGVWRMLRLALAAFGLALAVSALAPAVPALVAAQCLAGMAAGVVLPAAYAGAAAVAPPGRESATIGVVLTGWTLSMVVGVAAAAVLADAAHWRLVFGSVALLAGVALAALPRQDLAQTRPAEPASSPLQALRIRGVAPLLVACGAFMTAFYGVYGYLGDHVHAALGRPLSLNGLVALVYGLGFGSAAMFDRIVDRVGAARAMPAAYLAIGAIYVAMAISSDRFTALLALVFVWGLANHFGLNVLVMRLGALDAYRRGAIMGLNSAVTYLAVFIGTIGFGPVYAAAGFSALCLLAAALMLAAVAAARVADVQPPSPNRA
ncbi:MAG: MFS transporter [Rhizobiaceae bacterium]|nr:MFS transporter [Rhizobiaceae bacterium]MCV0404785.1 MFS transporter [Rhizobiaceae bacterium]